MLWLINPSNNGQVFWNTHDHGDYIKVWQGVTNVTQILTIDVSLGHKTLNHISTSHLFGHTQSTQEVIFLDAHIAQILIKIKHISLLFIKYSFPMLLLIYIILAVVMNLLFPLLLDIPFKFYFILFNVKSMIYKHCKSLSGYLCWWSSYRCYTLEVSCLGEG